MIPVVLLPLVPLILIVHVIKCSGDKKSAKVQNPPTNSTVGPPIGCPSPSTGTSNEKPQQQSKQPLAPKTYQLNEKEALIKRGLQTGKNAYPTLEDIPSDWSDKEKEKEKKGKESKEKSKKEGGDKSKKKEEKDKKDASDHPKSAGSGEKCDKDKAAGGDKEVDKSKTNV